TGQPPNRVRVREVPSLTAIIPAPVHSSHALQKHRQKDEVHANQRRPEMHFPPEIVHPSAGRLREPKINASKKPEDRAGSDDVMEMRDHVISVVQIKISRVKRQRNARKSADSKHRQECRGEKHWHGKSNRAAPE